MIHNAAKFINGNSSVVAGVIVNNNGKLAKKLDYIKKRVMQY
ncbi:TPA_asm: hypothetical protein GZT07_13445 [Listeria monocytogenes]|nr:hypothetical protein [Listeria monocytogenes]EAC6576085.1 hypothetical protein [Listeria monocytogenes]EAC6588758.1 hypothetical protein [Listeria monocytogenes]EAD5700108.1 hypothetical protein [Listeria monocytogenes]EAD5702711.1 hypothetical protein [Listeria monocytogenes]